MGRHQSKGRRNIIGISLGIIAIIVLALLFWPGGDRQGKRRLDAKTLNKMYKEALSDLAKEDYAQAATKLNLITKDNPNYKDTQKRLKEAKEGLIKQSDSALKKDDTQQAQQLLEALESIDPNYPGLQDKISDVYAQLPDVQAPGGSSSGGSSGGNEGTGTGGGGNNNGGGSNPQPKEISDDATPLSLLLSSLEGYRIIQNGWLQQPWQSGSTYIPYDTTKLPYEDARQRIDRIFLTIEKFDSKSKASERLKWYQDMFPLSSSNVDVNYHSAYYGLYNESKPDVYPYIGAMMWTRDNWFFLIQIVPRVGSAPLSTQPSTEYKKNMGLDVAKKLGY